LLTFVTIPEMTLNDILSLNVGGRIFLTARSTLISEPDSMLANMFDPNAELEPSQMVDGAFFIDADPEKFGILLNYLRNKIVDIPPNISKHCVLESANYFGLKQLATQLQYEMKSCEIVNLNVGGRIFSTKRSTLRNCPGSVLDNLFDPDNYLQAEKMEDGSYFIDSDPARFEVVLNYLRDQPLKANIDIPLNVTRKGLILTAQTFGLRQLAAELQKEEDDDEKNRIENQDVVRFNVSGEIFEISKDFLEAVTKGALPRILATNVKSIERGKTIFMDCDPRDFEVVLRYVRHMRPDEPGYPPVSHENHISRVNKLAQELLGWENPGTAAGEKPQLRTVPKIFFNMTLCDNNDSD